MKVPHRRNQYLNQPHRAEPSVAQVALLPALDFRRFESACRCCASFRQTAPAPSDPTAARLASLFIGQAPDIQHKMVGLTELAAWNLTEPSSTLTPKRGQIATTTRYQRLAARERKRQEAIEQIRLHVSAIVDLLAVFEAQRLCVCGCGRFVVGPPNRQYYEDNCRARAFHARRRFAGLGTTKSP